MNKYEKALERLKVITEISSRYIIEEVNKLVETFGELVDKQNTPTTLVRVKYRGSTSDREYDYIYQGDVKVGDTVVVPLKHGEKHAIVTKTFVIKEILRVGE